MRHPKLALWSWATWTLKYIICTPNDFERIWEKLSASFYSVFISRPDSESAIEFDDESNADEESVSLCERKNQQPNGKNIFDLE